MKIWHAPSYAECFKVTTIPQMLFLTSPSSFLTSLRSATIPYSPPAQLCVHCIRAFFTHYLFSLFYSFALLSAAWWCWRAHKLTHLDSCPTVSRLLIPRLPPLTFCSCSGSETAAAAADTSSRLACQVFFKIYCLWRCWCLSTT